MLRANIEARGLFVLAFCLCAFIPSLARAVALPDSDTTVSIYGYAKLDMMYDTGDVAGGSNGMGDRVNFSDIGVSGQNSSSGYTNFTANQSRLGIKTVTPTEKGDLITDIEGDFLAGKFRLRQAFGSWNGITAGQTWSNFHTFISTTPTLDFYGPIGRDAILRQPQIRYSLGHFHIALEDPGGAVSGHSFDGGYSGLADGHSIAGTDVNRKDNLPDLTFRYESDRGPLKFAAAAVVRSVAFDDGTHSDSTTAWGAFLAGSARLASRTVIRGQITGGDGLGGYMKGNPAPAAYRVGNSLKTIPAWGGTLGISQGVGPGRINLAYSITHADWSDAQDAGLVLVKRSGGGGFINAYDKTYREVHLNYIWKPTKRVAYGVEMIRAQRQTVDNRKGEVTRFQGSVIYYF